MILEPIHYIHLNHSANNTTILPQFWITVVFNFSWEYCNTQEKFETIVMQNFWGWTRCIMVYVKIVNGEKRSSWEKNVFKFVTQAARKKNSESQQQESNLCSTSFLSRHIWTSHRSDSVGGNLYFFFWAVSFLENNSSAPKVEMPVPSDMQYDLIQAIQCAFC